ncbi:tRNA guanosine(34) transglycosylase Tgt [bacterium]|nr:tRNA guanosine(34) transglycosylase Tgt [bacterium]
MKPISFSIEKKGENGKMRVGILETSHGAIETPAFAVVGTNATVKAVTPEMLESIGAEVVLANTYHLYLEPGDEIVKSAGGLGEFMGWHGPTMTDSGGFQVFSLGVAFGEGISKILDESAARKKSPQENAHAKLCAIDEDGVTFRSHRDGSEHRFTPERSIEIQHNIGADIIFAFDECTSPLAPHEYQNEACGRTLRWAKRSLAEHKRLGTEKQALFGVVQGGRFEDLRRQAARDISALPFDGFGIGGSFEKKDIDTAVGWVCEELPEDKPRHLFGIGEPLDILGAVEQGIDLFDCVIPTRLGRNGTIMTRNGNINILNAAYRRDFSPIEKDCVCYTCKHFARAYIHHLFKAREMLAGTLASIHNLSFITRLFGNIRESVQNGSFADFRSEFRAVYAKNLDKKA